MAAMESMLETVEKEKHGEQVQLAAYMQCCDDNIKIEKDTGGA